MNAFVIHIEVSFLKMQERGGCGSMSVDGSYSTLFNNKIRASHPLRSLKYQQGDQVNLIYLNHPSEVIEYENATFIKCGFVPERGIDCVFFSYENVFYSLPLHQVGVVGVEIDRVK